MEYSSSDIERCATRCARATSDREDARLQFSRLRGFQDLLGADTGALSTIEHHARKIAERYTLQEIRVPVVERAELYLRSSGETSDIVEKQMYTFADRDEASTMLALRPEGTPGVVRAYIDAGLDRSDPEQRFFYCGAMFRRERPQKGRYRQFWQFGVEIFGRPDAACDAELIIMIDDLRRELGLSLNTELNSLGDSQCRPAFRQAVFDYGKSHWNELCEDCRQRIERNPLRLLDCKIDVRLAEGAPKSADFLCDDCRKHFDTVVALISRAGVPHLINPRLVRGLDYYNRTAFEVVSTAVGSQNAVVAGGRYDGLVEALGGAPVPGTGFAIGVDRMALALETAGPQKPAHPDAAVIALGDAAVAEAVMLATELRRSGLRVELFSPERSLKTLMRRADKIGARCALIIGADELSRGVVQIRDLKASAQREVARREIADAVASLRS
jgi:histidyl-tRNA synthetase